MHKLKILPLEKPYTALTHTQENAALVLQSTFCGLIKISYNEKKYFETKSKTHLNF